MKDSKIIVTVGCSNSGKSTFAHNEWLKNPLNTVVINRDKLCETLFSYTEQSISEYYQRPDLSKLEKVVTKYEDTLIHEALQEGKDVIVDATHLENKYLDRFEFWNVPIEYVYFDISLEETLLRDSLRNRKVGEEVIRKQYDKYKNLQRRGNYVPVTLENKSHKQPCTIYDLDGTLADMAGKRGPYDWDKVDQDDIVTSVKNAIGTNNTLIICTGRDFEAFERTNSWLEYHDIPYDHLMMRKNGDQRPDWVVKEEMWRSIVKSYYIEALYDDQCQVVRRARSLGLKVFQVEYGNF